jgi:aminoglycoside phosphotransferase
MLSNRPDGTHRTPRIVAELADGRPTDAVWLNDLGGLTFQLGEGDGQGQDETREFLKWVPHSSGIDLNEEIQRLQWAVHYIAVPRVLKQGGDDEGTWFLSAGLPGTTAVDDRWKQEPATAVQAIGQGLRALHDTLPVADCPFDHSAESRLARARAAAMTGTLPPSEHWPENYRTLGVDNVLALLADIPPVDKLVVCHGDTCAPNTLIGDDGRWTAHVDLDTLGIADRWADLAVATWSTEWNYGPGWTEPLLEAYGIAPDWDRITYYRLLWSLAD